MTERNSDGKYKVKCSALTHSDTVPDCSEFIQLSKVPRGKKRKLEDDGIIPKSARGSICKKCMDHDDVNGPIGTITDAIKEDIRNLGEKFTFKDLTTFNAKSWFKERPKSLQTVLQELCGIDDIFATDKEFLVLCKITELVYGLYKSNLVTPLSFTENLLTHKITGAKQMVSYNSQVSPSGSYTYIKDWLDKEAEIPIPFPLGLVKRSLDNSQKIGKTYKMNVNEDQPMSTITTAFDAVLDESSEIQFEDDNKPEFWMFEEVLTQLQHDAFFDDDNDLFRSYRDEYILKRLQMLRKTPDDIPKYMEMEKECETTKRCVSCGAESDPSQGKCQSCDHAVNFQPPKLEYSGTSESLFENFDFVENSETPVKFSLAEPDLWNPSGYHNIADNLRNLGIRAGISRYGTGQREWLIVEVDGTIYTVTHNLIMKTFICCKCNESTFINKKDMADGNNMCCGEELINREFDWIVLLPGLLHLEMAFFRAFVSVNWNVFVGDLAKVYGYKSDAALAYAKSCSGHHKTWRLLHLVFHSLGDEILHTFLTEQNSTSIADFWSWVGTRTDPNFIFMFEMIFNYLFSIMLFRVGVRNCNYATICVAIKRLSPLVFARNQGPYQRILVTMMANQSAMPEQLRGIIAKYISMSRTGNKNSSQGGDACLEEYNKAIKKWLPKIGIPSHETWTRTIRTLENLEKVRTNLYDALSSEDSNDEQVECERKPPVEDIFLFRAHIRGKKYFIGGAEHVSITGDKLDEDLVAFTSSAKELMEYKTKLIFADERLPKSLVIPVTEVERNLISDPSSMTIDDLQARIEVLLESGDEELMSQYEIINAASKKKDALAEFYKSLTNPEESL